MFNQASLFNGDISSWDVSKVIDMKVSILAGMDICDMHCVLIMKNVLQELSIFWMDICNMNGGNLMKIDWM